MSEYTRLLEEVGGDPRSLAAVAANSAVAAILGVKDYFPTSRAPQTYETKTRLEQVGGDPRVLASAAANPAVAAILGLSL